jgi:hypothetical protein
MIKDPQPLPVKVAHLQLHLLHVLYRVRAVDELVQAGLVQGAMGSAQVRLLGQHSAKNT